MSLREGDALPYLRFKENLAETDCNAILSNSAILPVLIRSGGSQLFVELEDYTFHDPEKLPGFVRFERKPNAQQPRVEENPPVESTKLKGSSWAELRASAEAIERKARAEQHAAHQEQQGISTGDSVLAKAFHKHKQDAAARLRPLR